MNIARRLQLIALLVMLALAFLSWFSINRLSAANNDLGYVTDNTVPSISLIKQVQADFYELHALIQTHVLNTDNSKMNQIETGIADLRTEIRALLQKYEADMLSNEEDRQLTTDDQRIIEQGGRLQRVVPRLAAQHRRSESLELAVQAREHAVARGADILAACGQLKSESEKQRASARIKAEREADDFSHWPTLCFYGAKSMGPAG